jgi:hypothetical protein
MNSARVVEASTEYVDSPCDWVLRSEPSSDRWLKLYRDEAQELGAAAITLSALRYLTHRCPAYFGGHDEWELLAGVSGNTVTRHADILVDRGYIVRDGRQGPRYRRYKLLRPEPKTTANDAFSVMPLGFMSRVTSYADRVVFSLVVSSFRRAEGIMESIHPDITFDEEFLFTCFLRHEHDFHASKNGILFRLTAKTAQSWGISERVYFLAKKRLLKQGLIEVLGNDGTYVVPSGRSDKFAEIMELF